MPFFFISYIHFSWLQSCHCTFSEVKNVNASSFTKTEFVTFIYAMLPLHIDFNPDQLYTESIWAQQR